MADDLHESLDAIQEDMAGHQRRFAGEVTASSNHMLAVDAIQRIDRERAESKPAPTQANHVPTDVIGGTERRDGEHGSYVVSKSPTDDIKVRPARPDEHWFLQHAEARLLLLLTKKETGPLGQPSWNHRVMALLNLRSKVPGARIAGLHDYAAALEKRFSFELAELLEASSATFGDWRKDSDPSIQVAVR